MAVGMGAAVREDFRDTFLFLPQLFIEPTRFQAVGRHSLVKIGKLYINTLSSLEKLEALAALGMPSLGITINQCREVAGYFQELEHSLVP